MSDFSIDPRQCIAHGMTRVQRFPPSRDGYGQTGGVSWWECPKCITGASGSPSGAPVLAVDRSRSTPEKTTAVAASPAQEATPPRERECGCDDCRTCRAWDRLNAERAAKRVAAPTPEASTEPRCEACCEPESHDMHQGRGKLFTRHKFVRPAREASSAPGEYDELFAEAADYIRSIHHYAGSADHPAMKERIEGDVAGILDDLRATVAALTAERGERGQGQLNSQQD